ncbi:MAG: hypothetical protein IPJ00_22340 [Saprospirales bacterium]|nr:hypothetical protein [Saprospirales bacterium]
MRAKLICTCLIVFSLFALELSAQWQVYTPALPDTVGTFDLRIADGNDQVAWGVSMKYDVMPDGYYWLAMDSLIYTKTSDGGETWTGGTIPMGPEPYASNICPVSADMAWASGLDFDYVNYIMRTTDGGQTWERQFEEGFVAATSYINFVHFWDEQNGIAMGDPAESDTHPTPFFEIYKTDDGEKTGPGWTPPISPLPSRMNMVTQTFTTWWAITFGSVPLISAIIRDTGSFILPTGAPPGRP